MFFGALPIVIGIAGEVRYAHGVGSLRSRGCSPLAHGWGSPLAHGLCLAVWFKGFYKPVALIIGLADDDDLLSCT